MASELCFPEALVLDLLDYTTYTELISHPDRLEPIVSGVGATEIGRRTFVRD